MASIHGVSIGGMSPSTSLKRDRLLQRNAILRRTGFIEAGAALRGSIAGACTLSLHTTIPICWVISGGDARCVCTLLETEPGHIFVICMFALLVCLTESSAIFWQPVPLHACAILSLFVSSLPNLFMISCPLFSRLLEWAQFPLVEQSKASFQKRRMPFLIGIVPSWSQHAQLHRLDVGVCACLQRSWTR